jgi:hypothetical protein
MYVRLYFFQIYLSFKTRILIFLIKELHVAYDLKWHLDHEHSSLMLYNLCNF